MPCYGSFISYAQEDATFADLVNFRLKEAQSTMFFFTASPTQASTVDGIHLDEGQRRLLGEVNAGDIFGKKNLLSIASTRK